MKLKNSTELLNALADPTRLRILNLLSEGELCVCDLMSVLKVPQSKISRHLAYLRRTNLVDAKKDGLWMYYRLSNGSAQQVRTILKALTIGNSALEEFKQDLNFFQKNKSCLVACCK